MMARFSFIDSDSFKPSKRQPANPSMNQLQPQHKLRRRLASAPKSKKLLRAVKVPAKPLGVATASMLWPPVGTPLNGTAVVNGRAKNGTPKDEAVKELVLPPKKKPPRSSPRPWQSPNQ